MTLKINSLAPDFKAKTTIGDISFHHIIRLLMILFTVPIMVKILNKKKGE